MLVYVKGLCGGLCDCPSECVSVCKVYSLVVFMARNVVRTWRWKFVGQQVESLCGFFIQPSGADQVVMFESREI